MSTVNTRPAPLGSESPDPEMENAAVSQAITFQRGNPERLNPNTPSEMFLSEQEIKSWGPGVYALLLPMQSGKGSLAGLSDRLKIVCSRCLRTSSHSICWSTALISQAPTTMGSFS